MNLSTTSELTAPAPALREPVMHAIGENLLKAPTKLTSGWVDAAARLIEQLLEERKHLYTGPDGAWPAPVQFDMLAHLARQREFSEKTFGPGVRTKGVVDHIRKELLEIEGNPADLTEWIDVVILALDGAWRAGGTPAEIVHTMVAKQTKNEGRQWPDWRTAPLDKAIEHVRVAA